MNLDREHFEALRTDLRKPPVITKEDFEESDREEMAREESFRKNKEAEINEEF